MRQTEIGTRRGQSQIKSLAIAQQKHVSHNHRTKDKGQRTKDKGQITYSHKICGCKGFNELKALKALKGRRRTACLAANNPINLAGS
jgi:hypothetical protein